MIVICNSCQAKYSVDERKIPSTGVKVKCHKCQNIILIKPPETKVPPVMPSAPSPPKAAPTPPKPAVPEPPPAPVAPGTVETAKPSPAPTPSQPVMPEPPKPIMPEMPAEPSVEKPVEETPVPPPAKPAGLEMQGTEYQTEKIEPPSVAVPEPKPVEKIPAEEGVSEEDKKWHQRAKRLAKALASDLVLYNQSKVEEGLRDGTLAQLLGAEIRRSWEYYCQQIPKKIVENTDYFKEQLNKIVGKGKEIFK